MKELAITDLNLISGGNPALAVIEGAALFIAIPEIGGAIGQDWSYPTLGAGLGEFVFDITHGDQLGQMTYDASDFGLSYIPSAFPNEYPHW